MISTRTTLGLGVILGVTGFLLLLKAYVDAKWEMAAVGIIFVLLGFLLMGIEITKKE